jgi:hypothetical protein
LRSRPGRGFVRFAATERYPLGRVGISLTFPPIVSRRFFKLTLKERERFDRVAALSVGRRILRGCQFGFLMGAVFSILVIIIAVLDRSLTFRTGDLEFSVPALVGAYVIGGILAGLVYGAFFPFLRSSFGTIATGIVAAFFPIAGVTYSQPSTWRGATTEDMTFVVLATLVWGFVGGFLVRAVSIADVRELHR